MAASHNNGHVVLVVSVISFLWVHLIPKREKNATKFLALPFHLLPKNFVFVFALSKQKKMHCWCSCVLTVDDATDSVFTSNFTEGHVFEGWKGIFTITFCFNFLLCYKVRNSIYWKAMLMTRFFLIFYLWISSQLWVFGNTWWLHIVDSTPFFFLHISHILL